MILPDIGKAQLDMVIDHSRASRRFKAVFVLIVFLIIYRIFPCWQLVLWLALNIAYTMAREIFDYRYKRNKYLSLDRMTWLLMALLVYDGIVFGMLAYILPAPPDSPIPMLFIAIVASSTAVSFMVLHAHYRVMLAHTVALLAPIVIWQFTCGSQFGQNVGWAGIVLIALFAIEGWTGFKNIRELLRRRFEMGDLAAEREAALELARRNDRAKSQFLAVMSHELRTPLHGMLGVAELLKRDGATMSPPVLAANVENLHLTGEHLLSVVNHVLDFAKHENEPIQLRPGKFDLVELLNATARISRISADAGGLYLHLHCSMAAPCWVNADEPKLRQVLLNIVGNAIKFTDQGGVTITADQVDVKDYRIEVRDTGAGIKAQDMTRIFEPFEQADIGVAGRSSGTGLGLSISRELVHAMGGTLTAASVLGKGSCFTLRLPLESALDSALDSALESARDPVLNSAFDSAPSVAVPVDMSTPTPPPLPLQDQAELLASLPGQFQGHVLLAEDNRLSAYVMVMLLRRLGLVVETAVSGLDAVELCRTNRFTVALMDCQMPGIDGFEATRRIRQIEQQQGWAPMTIIALTANALDGDREKCLAAGMDNYLAKPFGQRDLIRMLAQYCEYDLRASNTLA